EIYITFGEIIAIGREPPVIEDRIKGLGNGVAEAVMKFDIEASTVEIVIIINEPVGKPHVIFPRQLFITIDWLANVHVAPKNGPDRQTDVIPSSARVEEFAMDRC